MRRLSAVTELGLFPLGLVLFPTERIPLHIFEPRYRELIGECVAEDGEFGIVLEADGGVHEVGTRARVTRVLEVFDDGRMNIIVEGGERFRIVELTSGRSFQTAEVDAIEDEDDPPAPDEVERVLGLYRELVRRTESMAEEPDPESDEFSFDLGARIDFGDELKQELLELQSPRERVERMVELLDAVVEAVRAEQVVKDRAERNGKVSPPGDGGTTPPAAP
jgi:Lon protease-like protein